MMRTDGRVWLAALDDDAALETHVAPVFEFRDAPTRTLIVRRGVAVVCRTEVSAQVFKEGLAQLCGVAAGFPLCCNPAYGLESKVL